MQSAALFFATVLLILMTPGPTNILLAASGLAGGLSRSWSQVGAVVCSYLAAIAVLTLTALPVIERFPNAAVFAKVTLFGYLIMLSVKIWSYDFQSGRANPARWQELGVATALNPKTAVFALAVFPAFGVLNLAALYLVLFCLAAVVASVAWLLIGASGRILPRKSVAVTPKIAAGLLVLFAVTIAAAAF